jgi:hypothetical protein
LALKNSPDKTSNNHGCSLKKHSDIPTTSNNHGFTPKKPSSPAMVVPIKKTVQPATIMVARMVVPFLKKRYNSQHQQVPA